MSSFSCYESNLLSQCGRNLFICVLVVFLNRVFGGNELTDFYGFRHRFDKQRSFTRQIFFRNIQDFVL